MLIDSSTQIFLSMIYRFKSLNFCYYIIVIVCVDIKPLLHTLFHIYVIFCWFWTSFSFLSSQIGQHVLKEESSEQRQWKQ